MSASTELNVQAMFALVNCTLSRAHGPPCLLRQRYPTTSARWAYAMAAFKQSASTELNVQAMFALVNYTSSRAHGPPCFLRQRYPTTSARWAYAMVAFKVHNTCPRVGED